MHVFILKSQDIPFFVPDPAAALWPAGQRNAAGLPSALISAAEDIRRTAYNMAVLDESDGELRRLVSGQGSLAFEARVLELFVEEAGVRAPYWRKPVSLDAVLAELAAAVERSKVTPGPPRVRYS